jgi:RNA polymerase sigma factor (sigma-70 family)
MGEMDTYWGPPISEAAAFEIADAMGVRPRDVVQAELRKGGTSIEWQGEVVSIESLPEDLLGIENFMRIIYYREMKAAVHAELANLNARERVVLSMRYGLGSFRSHSYQEIGKKFGVTWQRIRQIETKGLRKLKHPSAALEHYL